MKNWREKYYCKVVGTVLLIEGVLMLFSLVKYDLWDVWQAQLATWLFLAMGIFVIGENVLSNRKEKGSHTEGLESFKDKYYDKLIAGLYIIQWAILLFGEFQYDIGKYFIVDLVTWGSISMAIIIILDESEFMAKKKQ